MSTDPKLKERIGRLVGKAYESGVLVFPADVLADLRGELGDENYQAACLSKGEKAILESINEVMRNAGGGEYDEQGSLVNTNRAVSVKTEKGVGKQNALDAPPEAVIKKYSSWKNQAASSHKNAKAEYALIVPKAERAAKAGKTIREMTETVESKQSPRKQAKK